MSKARILADLISDSQITASEITGLELNSIQEGDTVVQVSDTGSGGKVVVRVDGADNAEFNANGMVIPKGTTAERDPAAVVGSLRYNTTTGFFESFTGSGWGSIATPPSITGITPSNFSGEAGSTFTVNGAFFDPDTIAVFKGADGTEYAAATVTFIDSTQLTVTNATNLPVANEPFRVKVTNGAGLSVESVQGIDAGSVPAFTTAAGSIATTTRWDEAVSVTVQATDAENTISGYAVTEGNLPTGLTLDGTTGAITGTSTEQATTTYTFTIEATDSAGNTNTRQFSIQIVNAAPVWNSPAEGSTQELEKDTAGSITLSATDPEGEPVIYSAVSLPTGLNLSGNLITGTPTVEANTSVAVTASDGFSSSIRNFFINVSTLPFPLNLSFESSVRSHLIADPQGSSILDTVGTASLSAVNTTGLSTGFIDTQTPARSGSSVQRSIRGEWEGYVDTNLTGPTTQSYWVYMHSDASAYWMFYAGAGLMHMYNQNTTYRIGGNGDSGISGVNYGHHDINTTGDLWQTGVWQHYTWVTTVQGGVSTTVYKNGQQVAYEAFSSYDGNSSTSQFLRLGARGSGSGQYADVSLDDILVIDRALTSSEVTELYQAASADF